MPVKQVSFSELIHFSPKQLLATKEADSHKFTLYGGSNGGGKSYWIRWYIIRWLIRQYKVTGQSGIVAGLFCEDYPALKDRHVAKMNTEFPEWLGTLRDSSIYGLSFQISPELGSGVIALRNLDDPSKYFSSEFALIAVDELTKNQKSTFDMLRMRLRWSNLADTRFIAGTNPGGIGHVWCRDFWVKRNFPPEEKEQDEFVYVPATVDDNPYLDPGYIRALESLPLRMQKAYRYGDWDVFEGQFFSEFDVEKHVRPWFKVPESWAKMRSIDPSGQHGVTSCHWYALDSDGKLFCYREYYATGLDSDQHAQNIAKMSRYVDTNLNQEVEEEYKYTVMDSAAWSKMGASETQAEAYERHGVHGLIPASKDREFGANIVHEYLRWEDKDEAGRPIEVEPRLLIMDTCPHMIRTIPLLIHDEYNPADVDTHGDDHPFDDLKYVLMTLRGQKSARSETYIERRMRQRQEAEQMANANYNYAKR